MLADWRPSCCNEALELRAKLLRDIRHFFADRSVLEVETPLLSHTIGTDPHLAFFRTEYGGFPGGQTLFLQTSPEFAMKRLLAAGSGSIYQICKAFRDGESGHFHNPEFTLLEWYRLDFTLSQLMDEIEALFALLFHHQGYGLGITERVSYQAAFKRHTGLDPLQFTARDYADFAIANKIPEAIAICDDDHAIWLDFIFSHKVQPHLGVNALCMVYGYPACQSSLARNNAENPAITERVELFINGVELGNGYHELADANEQGKRFDREIVVRQQRRLPAPVKDERLLAALGAGLPNCSGIAIGLDRVLMLLAKKPQISDVLSFAVDRA